MSDDVGDSGRGLLAAGVDMIMAGLAMVLRSSADELTHPELLAQMDRLKSVAWALPVVEHRMLARLAAEASPTELGGTSLADVLAARLRISKTEAGNHRRAAATPAAQCRRRTTAR